MFEEIANIPNWGDANLIIAGFAVGWLASIFGTITRTAYDELSDSDTKADIVT